MTLLSIVTITYNDLPGLQSTVASIDRALASCDSSHRVEHLVVDGNSTDGTGAFLQRLAGSRRVPFTYLSEADSGIYDAMNKGARLSAGRFVVFLNSGDSICENFDMNTLLVLLDKCEGAPQQAGLAFSSIIRYGGKSLTIASREVRRSTPRMPTVHQSMFFKRAVLLAFPFDCSYRICGDYDNFARIFTSGLTFDVCPEVFSVFQAGGVSSKSPLRLFLESTSVTRKHFRLNPLRRLLVSARLCCALLRFQMLLAQYGVAGDR